MSEFKTNKISPRKGTTQTIGDSGDTVTVSSGANICNAGTLTVSNLTNSGTITSTGTLTTAGISGGTINNTTGTISGVQGVIDWDTTPKTTGFTAVSQKGYFCNTTSASFTVTLPTSPSAGDIIAIKDYANTFDTNKISIAPNGNKIQGSTSTFECTDEGAALNFIYVDSTRGWVLTDASKASDITEYATFITATGGTITTSGNYKIHTFTSPGTFTVTGLGNPAGGPNNVDYLVVAGGGGGGGKGQEDVGGAGGGGAGGHRSGFPSPAGTTPVSVQGYPIVVGAGGAGGPNTPGPSGSPTRQGSNGSNSSGVGITSAGGGYGGNSGGAAPGGGPGGSGGGGPSFFPAGTGNTPPVSPPQGNNGGPGTGNRGGGGGGSGTGGVPGCVNANGGAGTANSITGSPITRAGGGGGGGYTSKPAGVGGSGGGGAGAVDANATSGTANTGGGGGGVGGPSTGTAYSGGSGGSGIVIIRYKYQ